MSAIHLGAPCAGMDQPQEFAAARPRAGAADALSSWAALQTIDCDVRGWRTGMVTAVTKIVLEAALEAELIGHLGYPKYDHAGRQLGSNSRNGTRPKKVLTWFGPIKVDVPRDRWGTFQPVTVGKWQRQVAGLDQLVLPLAAKGAPHEETVELLSWVYRGSLSRQLLGEIAAAVRERIRPWQDRPLEARYPVVVFDRVVVRSRQGAVASRPVHTAVGLSSHGQRELLGLWIATNQTKGELWFNIGADLKSRGVSDVDGIVCDPIPGLAGDLRMIWPDLVVRQRPKLARPNQLRSVRTARPQPVSEPLSARR